VVYLDNSAPAGWLSWSPTINYTGSSSTTAIGFLNNSTYDYPFIPNTNYDFERGSVAAIRSYNESNQIVNESVYTYQTPQVPVIVSAFAFAANTGAEMSYGKYFINTTAIPLLTQVVSKQYDYGSTTAAQTSTILYTYGGSQHKKVTKQTAKNSNGSEITSNTSYVKDYIVTSGGDAMTQALLILQTANANLPVETYKQVKPSGGTASTVKAALTKYGVFTIAGQNLTLPSQQLTFNAPSGGAYSPATISGGNTFSYPANQYMVIGNQLAYDNSGYLLSADDGFKHVSSMFTDHKSFQTIATVSNARYDEVAFSDFDSKLGAGNFVIEGSGALTTTSRTGQYGLTLNTGNNLTKVLTKNTLAKNYIVSAWVKTGTTGTITAALYGGGSVTRSLTLNAGSTPTGWQYYEFKLPLTGITTPTVEIDLWGSQNIILDDVWAYPDIAKVNTVALDPVSFYKTAITNTNGVSAYYINDKFGRQLYMLDQDKNILSRNIYVSGTTEAAFTAPAISGPTSLYTNQSGTWSFTAPSYSSCIYTTGLTYTYDFGDGSAPSVTTASYYSIPHNYTASGTYTVKLTVNSPMYGARVSTQNVTVSTLTATAVTYTNSTTGASIGSITFKQGPTTIYTFNTTQLTAGQTITPGVYTIVIHPIGGHYNASTHQGYNSILVTPTDVQPCYTGGDLTISSMDLSGQPAVNFNITTTACGI
jgi:hypothetical protein